MKSFIAMLSALVLSMPAFAENDFTYVGSVDDEAFYVLTDTAKGNAPYANKHGIVWANVVSIYHQTRNGHIKGGAHRTMFGVDCDTQQLMWTTVWSKRSTNAEMVWVDDELVGKRISEAKFEAIKPNSVGAAVSDFACAYVKQAAPAPSTVPPDNNVAPKTKGEYVPL